MNSKLYFAASLIFVLLGIGHLLIEIFSGLILPSDHYIIYKAMSDFHLRIFGFTRSILDFMKGFSYTMGFMMFVYGVFNLLILKVMPEKIINNSVLLIFNVFVSSVLVILSIIYFHWPPIVFYSISMVLFLIIFFNNIVKQNSTN